MYFSLNNLKDLGIYKWIDLTWLDCPLLGSILWTNAGLGCGFDTDDRRVRLWHRQLCQPQQLSYHHLWRPLPLLLHHPLRSLLPFHPWRLPHDKAHPRWECKFSHHTMTLFPVFCKLFRATLRRSKKNTSCNSIVFVSKKTTSRREFEYLKFNLIWT